MTVRAKHRACCWGWIWISLALATGCKMTAPIHVWRKPTITQGGPIKVAVAPVGGDLAVAGRLQDALALSRPQTMPQLAVIQPDQLEQIGGIQLASYDGQPSEMASLSAARRAGAQYLLAGNVVSHQLNDSHMDANGAAVMAPTKSRGSSDSVTVRWCVYDVASGQRLGDETIKMTAHEANKSFPDLSIQSDSGAKVIAASARKSWQLVVPTTQATQVMIDLPWFWMGSSKVRKGNAYARMGQWESAEREWQDAVDKHVWNTAAWRNLAIAAVAREDYALARSRLSHAEWKYWPGNETDKTLKWIEEQQREYHAAFQLPPPAEGWVFPEVPTSASVSEPKELGPNQPVSIDEQPWYTVLPFMPPPGWTWSQWWSQPWVW